MAGDAVAAICYDGRNIEDLIGYVEEEFPCRYSGVSGTLYAGTDGVAFLGKFFLFDKKLYLKWVDVKVQQSDHGVTMQTRDIKEELAVIHEFTGIQRPERCWSMLVSLHNQALLDRPSGTPASTQRGLEDTETLGLESGTATATVHSSSMTVPPIQRRRTLRRMTSDPNKLAPAIDALFAENTKEGETLSPEDQNDKHDVASASSKATSRRTSLLSPNVPTIGVAQTTKEEMRASLRSIVGVVEVSPPAEIEAIVGKIQGQFACRYSEQQGTLFAGSTALYFAGGRLFFPARITIQSTNIRQVKMVKGKPRSDLYVDEKTQKDVISHQGIVVWTREGISHTFLGMENPDHVWASLVALRNHVIKTGPNSPKAFGLRRMNSDPNLQSHTGFDLLSPTAGTELTGEGEKPGDREHELAPPKMSDEELQKAWSNIIEKESRYATSVAKDVRFACNLDKFFKTYLGNDAEFSLGNFLTGEGDKEVKASAWKSTNDHGRLVMNRVVRYIHPVNAPMAPPEAKARKEQTYQRLGDFGFIVETKTFVDDVPMADCFFVKDRLVVTASKPPEEATKDNPGPHVLVSMEFELEFVKSTMFRGIITRTTNKEVTDFGEKLMTYMAKNLAGEAPGRAKTEETVEIEMVVEDPSLFPGALAMASLTHLLLVVVIMMQLWMIMEMYSTKSAIRRLEMGEKQYFSETYFASHLS